MNRKVALCYGLIVFWGVFVSHPVAQSLERFAEEKDYVYEEELANGLAFLVKENHSAPIVHVNVYVKTGSIYEGEYMGHGISHHVEHIVAGGSTHSKTEAEYEEIRSSLGRDSNAGTSWNYTCYYINSSAENLPLMLEVLSDWVFNCIFAEDEVKREHGVIQREIEMGAEDPPRRLWEATMRTMFKVHPVRYPRMGYLEDFLSLTREDLVKYYDRWYVPENMVVVVVGDVETDNTVELMREVFGKYPRRSSSLITLPKEPPQLSTRVVEEEMDVKIAYLGLTYRTIPVSHPDLYALDLLSYLFTKGESAIFVKKIRDEMGLVSNISSHSFTPGYDAGHFGITAQLDPEKLDEAEEAIREELENLKHVKIDESLLQKAKKQKITEYIFDNQTMEQQASSIVRWAYLTTNDKYFYRRYVERIQEVTQGDLERVLNHYFTPNNLTIAKIVPKGCLRSVRVPVEKPTSHRIEKTVLENGMTLLTRIDENTPLITILATYRGGVLCEIEENSGISNFTVKMLLKGTEKMSADDISEKIDNMGIELSVAGGNNTFYVGFSLVSSDFDRALNLFAEIIKNPRFPPEEIEKMRDRLLVEVARREGEWYLEAADFFRQTFFARHPYRLTREGTRESLANIARQDLLDFHSRFCRPDNVVLAIFGDIEGLNVEEKVNRLFSNYRVQTPLNLPVNELEPELTESKRATKYTEKNLAVIYMGYPGMRVDDLSDRYPMEVLDAVVSGIRLPGGSWLHEALRGNELVYVVHAHNWMGLDPGYFSIYAATTPDKVDEAIELILEQMERIKVEDIEDDEFERAKGECITAERLNHQSNYDQALRSALDELYGLEHEFHEEHRRKIEAVTEDDVRRVANKYLNKYVLITTIPE